MSLSFNIETYYPHSLLGYFIDKRYFPKELVQLYISKCWILQKEVVVEKFGDIFLLRFQIEEDMKFVIQQGPINVNGAILLLEQCTPNTQSHDFKVNKACFWIQIHGIPNELFRKDQIERIALVAGEVIAIEWNANANLAKEFIRVKIRIPIYAPLVPGTFIKTLDNSLHWINFRYEKVFRVCYNCGKIGHNIKNCHKMFVDSSFPQYNKNIRAFPNKDEFRNTRLSNFELVSENSRDRHVGELNTKDDRDIMVHLVLKKRKRAYVVTKLGDETKTQLRSTKKRLVEEDYTQFDFNGSRMIMGQVKIELQLCKDLLGLGQEDPRLLEVLSKNCTKQLNKLDGLDQTNKQKCLTIKGTDMAEEQKESNGKGMKTVRKRNRLWTEIQTNSSVNEDGDGAMTMKKDREKRMRDKEITVECRRKKIKASSFPFTNSIAELEEQETDDDDGQEAGELIGGSQEKEAGKEVGRRNIKNGKRSNGMDVGEQQGIEILAKKLSQADWAGGRKLSSYRPAYIKMEFQKPVGNMRKFHTLQIHNMLKEVPI